MRWRSVAQALSFSRPTPHRSAMRGRRLAVEPLEHRALLATLPAGFTETPIAAGLNSATAMEIAPNGDLWVLEQGGDVKRFRAGSTAADVVGDISTLGLSSVGERGVLGIAFDPQYAANKSVYLYYTATSPNTHNRISRFTVNDTDAADYFFSGTNTAGDAGSSGAPTEDIILELDALSSATNHNGGAIHFGPDGKLYAAVGDNANGANAQTLANLHGKMLRINSDGTIPTDNPFFSAASGDERAIWALGLRNPFTFTFQPGSGRMFINDVGANAWEEINDGIAGSNYGWPNVEGNQGIPPTGPGTYRAPLYAYSHGGGPFQGFAITGGAFYNPTVQQFPAEFAGDYFFGEFVSDWINVRDAATGNVTQFATGALGAVDLRVASDGSLLYLARGQGQAFKVSFTAANRPPVALGESYFVALNGSLSVAAPGLLGNDTDADGDELAAIFVGGPAHGTLTLNSSGGFTYRPDANYTGGDAFFYRATDGQSTSNLATVALSIVTVNDAPSFVKGPNQSVPIDSGPQSVANWATQISAGPPDEALQSLTFEVTNNSNALFAVQPAIDASGRLTYAPAAGASGLATVTVILHDNGGTAAGGMDTSLPQTFTVRIFQSRPWHHAANPEDVDADTFVSPIDAVLIINYLNARLPAEIPPDAAPGPPFLDVDGDNFVSPIDAVLVINLLNSRR
jgi:glucose/arabinose dehydrogenase